MGEGSAFRSLIGRTAMVSIIPTTSRKDSCYPKVNKFNLIVVIEVPGDHDVIRLDVTMQYMTFVQLVNGLGKLQCVEESHVQGKLFSFDVPQEVSSIEVLKHQHIFSLPCQL